MLMEVHIERVESVGVIESIVTALRDLFNPQAIRIGANEERAMRPHEMQDHLVLLLH
jgi:hypothetical protein